MAEPETIEQAIEENAKGFSSVNVGGHQVTSKNVAEQIEAERYLAQKRARGLGFRVHAQCPPGTGA